jgi:hypothetical protein
MTTDKSKQENDATEAEVSAEEVIEEPVVEAEEASAEEAVAEEVAEESEVVRTPKSTTSAPQNRAELTKATTDRHAHNA